MSITGFKDGNMIWILFRHKSAALKPITLQILLFAEQEILFYRNIRQRTLV